jgi:uridine phosphorylase
LVTADGTRRNRFVIDVTRQTEDTVRMAREPVPRVIQGIDRSDRSFAVVIATETRQHRALAFLDRRDYHEPSVFLPENMLRGARRQRTLPLGRVPQVCVLDPDGDIVRYLNRANRASYSATWACFHTDLVETPLAGTAIGVVGGAVGGPFAVLVAEELFASGCELLLSVTSAGRIAADLPRSCIIVIEQALRGEGTSHAYLPPAPAVAADRILFETVWRDLDAAGIRTRRGTTWTTDAPFRETETAIVAAAEAGALAVEMEAAALYAFAQACRCPIISFAHVTNELGTADGDFEKGPADGAENALAIIAAVAGGWLRRREPISRGIFP